MVELAPFAAVRYAADHGGSRVLAPPYDVITPERRDALYATDPHNIVRIDLTRPEPGDDEDARYLRARSTLDAWLAAGVLVRDPAPALYVLEQSFVGPDGSARTRTGFFSRVRLAAYEERIILPHERTLRGPKLDRLKLLRATAHNLSPVFSIYRDANGAVAEELAAAKRAPWVLSAELDGVEQRLWRLDDLAAITRVQAALADARLYIADGHHRYETALAYRDERRARAEATPDAPSESVLMFSAPVEDPGLAIYPTHRVVFGLEDFDEVALLAKLAPFFAVTPAAPDVSEALETLAATEGPAFLLVTRTGRKQLAARPDAPFASLPTLQGAARKLDVAILHAVVLEHGLGISREAQTDGTRVRYTKDPHEAWTLLERGAGDVAAVFLLKPTRVEDVLATADAGQVMPEKSTFFFPKVPSGLLLYPLDAHPPTRSA